MPSVTTNLVQPTQKNAQGESQVQAGAQLSSNNTETKEMESPMPVSVNKLTDKTNQPPITSSASQQNSNKIPLKLVNSHITCSICNGYLIDATTLVECLHSFCHSCIMKHLRIQDYCPKCDVLVNKAKLNIRPDTTLQAIVYKLVPELYEKELLRRRAFYKMHPKEAALASPDQRGEDTENLIFSPNEALSLSLEYADMEELPKKSELKKPIYLQCPAVFKVSNLKKFILSKFGIDRNLLSVDLMYKVKTIVLPDHYTLMDIAYIYIWKRDAPMRFFFRVIKSLQSSTESETKTKTMDESLSTKSTNTCKADQNHVLISEKVKINTASMKCEKNNNNVISVKSNNESDRKHESIKLKIEISKQGNMVSILKTDALTEDSSNKDIMKYNDNQFENTICEPVKQKPALPKLLLMKSKSMKLSKDFTKQEIAKNKFKGTVKKLAESQKSGDSTKMKLDLTSKNLNKNKCENSKRGQNKTSSSTKFSNVPDMDLKKSEFLNTFQLAPRKIVSTSSTSPHKPLRPIAPKSVIPSLKPLITFLGTLPKRKNKEFCKAGSSTNINLINKKAKPNDLKRVLEKIIREKSNQPTISDKKETISFNLAPFPIGSTKTESDPTSLLLSQPTSPTSGMTDSSKVKKSPIHESSRKTINIEEPGSLKLSSTELISNKKDTFTQNKIISSSNTTSNNASARQAVPKRSISPNANNTSVEPVFKKPMIVTKKNVTPEKIKKAETHIFPNKNIDIGKSLSAPPNSFLSAPPNITSTPPHKQSNYKDNYLNFALLNASKNADQIRMARAPIYSPFSPVYAPNSPQYTPNFNLQSRPTFKYTNPQAYANLMDNLYKSNDLFPENKKKAQNNTSKGPPPKNPKSEQSANKSPKNTENQITTPPISQGSINASKSVSPIAQIQGNTKPNANSLLDKLNFPSSLSVTLTTDTDDSRTNSPNNKNHSSVNNYIEIVKLPESPTNHNENKITYGNVTQSKTTGIETPPGCISPPKTIIKIDDIKKTGDTVHKDIINRVNEMCATATGAVQNISPANKSFDNNTSKENSSSPSVLSFAKSNNTGKETFQTKFLESILPKMNEKSGKDDEIKVSSEKKTYLKTNTINNQKEQTPVFSKAVQSKLGELRKISPKPPQPQNKFNKIPITTSPSTVEKGQNVEQQHTKPSASNSSAAPNYQGYDSTKLANLFNDFAQASQGSLQNIFPIAANQITAYNAVPMVNLMQQAYLMEQWQKLQKLHKTAEQNYLENCIQTLKHNSTQVPNHRLE